MINDFVFTPPTPGFRVPEPKPAPVATKPMALPCVHLGPETGEVRPCQTCGGTVDVNVRFCKAYGDRCTESRVVTMEDGTPVRCCAAMCEKRQVATPAEPTAVRVPRFGGLK